MPTTAWQPDVPCNDLPGPPAVGVLEIHAVLKAAVSANAALAQLDQSATAVPNPAVLINAIPILEAQASSEIENRRDVLYVNREVLELLTWRDVRLLPSELSAQEASRAILAA